MPLVYRNKDIFVIHIQKNIQGIFYFDTLQKILVWTKFHEPKHFPNFKPFGG